MFAAILKLCIIILMAISPIMWVMFDRDIMVLSLHKLDAEGSTNFELNIDGLIAVNVFAFLVLLVYKLQINSEYTKNLNILMEQESMMQSKIFITLSKDLIHTMDDVEFVDTTM